MVEITLISIRGMFNRNTLFAAPFSNSKLYRMEGAKYIKITRGQIGTVRLPNSHDQADFKASTEE